MPFTPAMSSCVLRQRIIAMFLAGCLCAVAGGQTTSAPASAPAPITLPPDYTGLMAYVNGQPVAMDALLDLLVQGYGLTASQQVIATELVRQEAAKENITVTDDETAQMTDRTLQEMFPSVSEADQRQRLLEQLLVRNHVSRRQWDLTMRRNVMLDKLVQPAIQITDEILREELANQYGRRVVVRHIETASLTDAQNLLRELRDNKADFAALAQKHSLNATGKTGGLLPPVTENSAGIPPVIRDVALKMKTIGEISDPIQAGTAFHILKLEEIQEPQNVTFEEVKDKLARDYRQRQSRQLMQKLLQDLIVKAKIEYVKPILRSQAAGNAKPVKEP